MPDAPDWQRTVTGPGAAPVASGFPPNLATNYVQGAYGLTTTLSRIIYQSIGNTINEFVLVTFGCLIEYTTTDAATDGFLITIPVNHVPYGANSVQCVAGVVGTNMLATVQIAFWNYVPSGGYLFEVYGQMLGSATGEIADMPNSGGNFGIAVAYT